MKIDCGIISLLVVGTVFLTMASSSLKIPKIVSRRDMQTIGTLIIASAVIMLVKGACDNSKKAGYVLSPAKIGKVIIPQNLILPSQHRYTRRVHYQSLQFKWRMYSRSRQASH